MQQCVLIVEDDIDLAKILKATLERNGYKACVAIDGAEALDFVLKENVNLIVTDLKMNWIEGDLVVQLVREYDKTRRIPIIVYTGLSPQEIAHYQLEGVKAVIHKPLEPKLLLEKIKEVLLEPS